VLTLIAIWFSQIHDVNARKRTHYIEDLHKLEYDIKCTLNNLKKEVTDDIVSCFDNFNSCFILGKGPSEYIAKEGALKIKEVSYIHAESYSSSALKHGPFALLCENFPAVLIDNVNGDRKKNNNAYEEIKSRHAKIITITDDEKISRENVIIVAYNHTFGDLLSVIPLQYLAFKLAVKREHNPDTPTNLAKSVTV
jgi:glucosamine--fructose-6-phosphate aminotransferase (isomerizing)